LLTGRKRHISSLHAALRLKQDNVPDAAGCIIPMEVLPSLIKMATDPLLIWQRANSTINPLKPNPKLNPNNSHKTQQLNRAVVLFFEIIL